MGDGDSAVAKRICDSVCADERNRVVYVRDKRISENTGRGRNDPIEYPQRRTNAVAYLAGTK